MFKEAKKLLDQYSPGWAHRVNLRTLDMSACEKCILGQLFNGFANGTYILNISNRVQDYRFDRTEYWTYPRLTSSWSRFIKSVRRGGRIG